jgi:hypothetical protein
MILLHIGKGTCRAERAQRPGPYRANSRPGRAAQSEDLFHHYPPTALEIEQAIDVIEHKLMQLGARASPGVTLWSASADQAVSGGDSARAARVYASPGAMFPLPSSTAQSSYRPARIGVEARAWAGASACADRWALAAVTSRLG